MRYHIFVNYIGDGGCHLKHDAPAISIALEDIFAMFNHGSNRECIPFLNRKFRSLSVHDCVRVDEQWYQCRSTGWEKVTEEFVDELEKDVVNHSLYSLYGAWSALNDVMWVKHRRIS